MPRTFISFLGAIPYQQTKYYQQPDRSDLSAPMYYVQEAILAAQDKPWGADDKIWIFTTDEALTNNYEGRIINHKGDILPNQGLKAALQYLKQQGQIAHFDHTAIPNGYSTSEMWRVFEEVFSKLRDGDELYLDVTFGFRSLPMLSTILVNYARTLKQVQVKAIYYGIFEAGRQERTILNERLKSAGQLEDTSPTQAPIIDLNVFTELQDWTYAAQSFLDAGNPTALAFLTQDKHPAFSKAIRSFSQAILTCRGYNLTQTEPINELKATVGTLGKDSGLQQQLKPLLEKVEEKIQPFHSSTILNGFAAVQWCIDHGMVQQGITFLQETVVSYLVQKVIGIQELNNPVYRYAANGALRRSPDPNPTIKTKRDDINRLKMNEIEIRSNYESMYNFVNSIYGLSKSYNNLIGNKGFRNDINHCGFKDDPLTPAELTDKLKSVFNEIKSLLHVN